MLRSGMTSVKPKTSTRTMRKIGKSDFKETLAFHSPVRAPGRLWWTGADASSPGSRIMRPMAKKSAKKSKPKKRTAKAVTAAAKKTRASAARTKKAASPKKAARKVAKKAVARAKAAARASDRL